MNVINCCLDLLLFRMVSKDFVLSFNGLARNSILFGWFFCAWKWFLLISVWNFRDLEWISVLFRNDFCDCAWVLKIVIWMLRTRHGFRIFLIGILVIWHCSFGFWSGFL